jgi:hypothetical protein
LFVWVVDDFFEMSECSLCKRQKRSEDRDNERECLVWLITVIVDGSTAHPADFTELLTLLSSEHFKFGRVWIDECIIFVPFIRILGIRMKRRAKRECLEDRLHCRP